jgi:hypothetical protein
MEYTTGRGLGIACNTLRMLVFFISYDKCQKKRKKNWKILTVFSASRQQNKGEMLSKCFNKNLNCE